MGDRQHKVRTGRVWRGAAAAIVMACALGQGGQPARALDAHEMFDDPAEEARAREIGRQLRCLVCQNESIFDSNAGLAKDLRVLVRDRMRAGDSDADVVAYISDRYGDYVLLKPRIGGHTLVLWLAPLGFLAVGGLGLVLYHRGRRAQAAPEMTEAEKAEAHRLLQGE